MTDGCYMLGGSRTIWEVLKAPKIVQKRSVKVAEGEPEQILLTTKRKPTAIWYRKNVSGNRTKLLYRDKNVGF